MKEVYLNILPQVSRAITHLEEIDYALAWSLPMSYDILVFGLLLYKRLRIGKVVQNSIFTLLLRDGRQATYHLYKTALTDCDIPYCDLGTLYFRWVQPSEYVSQCSLATIIL